MHLIKQFYHDDAGATAIEYALIAAATGLALIGVMPTIKSQLTSTFTSLSSGLT